MKRFVFILILMLSLGMSLNAQQSEEYLEKVDSADYYIKQKRWAEAEQLLKEAMRIEPGNINNSLLFSNLGIVLHNQNKLEQAIESFTVGLAMTPNSFVLHKNRAAVYIDAGMMNEAYEDLTAAYHIDPTDLWVRNYHGLIALQKGELQTARNDFMYMLDCDVKSIEGLRGMAILIEVEGNLAEAIEYYTQILELEKSAENYFSRAFLYVRTDDLSAADDDVREGLKIDPYYGDLYLLRAYLSKLRYRYDDAQIDKNLAIKYDADVQLVQMLFPEEGAEK